MRWVSLESLYYENPNLKKKESLVHAISIFSDELIEPLFLKPLVQTRYFVVRAIHNILKDPIPSSKELLEERKVRPFVYSKLQTIPSLCNPISKLFSYAEWEVSTVGEIIRLLDAMDRHDFFDTVNIISSIRSLIKKLHHDSSLTVSWKVECDVLADA